MLANVIIIMVSRESEIGYSHAPVILSVIAGALILTGALLPLMYTPWGMMHGGMGMMSGWQWYQSGMPSIPSIVGLISGSLIILASIMLGNRIHERRGWGILILVASIVSLLSMGGFIIGSILGIISGALILSRPNT